jgi:MoaA/NifB/PqqE/SkfB family radical SAM enzyme
VHGLRCVTAVVTAACNLRCPYCYQDRRSRRRGMGWETLRAAVDLLLGSRRDDLLLWFSGGEPLLELPLLRRAVSYGESADPGTRRLRFGLSTNGLLLDDGAADFLAAHRVTTQISFDGPVAQELRAPGSFPALDGRLRRLRRRHPGWLARDVEVAITVTGANLPRLADSVDYFLERGVRTVSVGPRVTPDPDWTERSFAELDRQLGRVFQASRRFRLRTGRVPVTLFRGDGEAGARGPASEWLCGLGTGQTLAVDVDGSVVGCAMLAGSYQTFPTRLLREAAAALRLGSVRDPGLPGRLAAFPAALAATRLFDGQSRKHSSFGRCRGCRYRRSCAVCPVSIGRIPGNADPDRVPDVACAFNRVALRYRSRFPRWCSRRAIRRAPEPTGLRLAQPPARSRMARSRSFRGTRSTASSSCACIRKTRRCSLPTRWR